MRSASVSTAGSVRSTTCRSRPNPFSGRIRRSGSAGRRPKRWRAVRHGDAFMGAGSSTTAKFAEAVQGIRRELAEQGKDPATFPIGKRVYLIVDDDPVRARERALGGLHRIYG